MSRNVSAIKAIYEEAFSRLHEMMAAAMQSRGPTSAEDTIRQQVKWINEVSKTLLVVNQIESARKKPAPQPSSQVQPQSSPQSAQATTQAHPDPESDSVAQEFKYNKLRSENQNQTPEKKLTDFKSPKGWNPNG